MAMRKEEYRSESVCGILDDDNYEEDEAQADLGAG